MKRQRRETETFSLSFLDCICCGFGAVILLFVISLGAESRIIEGMQEAVEARFRALNAELSATETETAELARQQSAATARLAELEALAQSLEKAAATATAQEETLAEEISELETIRADRRRELAAREEARRTPPGRADIPSAVGIPLDRNYLIFVIDTSGSMRALPNFFDLTGRRGLWPEAIRQMDAALRAYPSVQGLQFLDADGRHIIESSAGQWLPDSPAQRRVYLEAVNRYQRFSQSNPVPGIQTAIQRYRDPDKRIAIFVVGDEFGGNVQTVLNRLERINPRGANGERAVSINGLAFPTPAFPGITAQRYADLMREVANAHDGAVIFYIR